MRTGERVHQAAEKAIGVAPRSARTIDWARRLERQGRRLSFLRRYLDLYREYAQTEIRYVDSNTVALYESLTSEDRATFAFDTGTIDWRHYIQDVHCPAITQPIRELDRARRGRPRRDPARLSVLRPTDGAERAPEEQRVAAYFDMDGTLLSSNVVETYLWMRLAELSPAQKVAETARIAGLLPKIVQADRHDRTGMLRAVYKEYAGARLADLDAIVDTYLAPHVLERLAPDAVRRIRQHRAAGHQTVLITGALRPLTRPLVPLFDHIEAADLAVDERGRCTGHLASTPLVGESRAGVVREHARRTGIDLGASYAYADSYSDLPMLEAVGHPVAVRPDVALYRHARGRGWNIVDWASSGTSSRVLDPVGRRDR
jgi:HAD superfamily hydrolase (TIGR01490 family)